MAYRPQPSGGQYTGQIHPTGWPNGRGGHHQNHDRQPAQDQSDWNNYEQARKNHDNNAIPVQYEEEAYHQTPQSYSPRVGEYFPQQQHGQRYQYNPRFRDQTQASNGQAVGRRERRERHGKETPGPAQAGLRAKTKCKWTLTCHLWF